MCIAVIVIQYFNPMHYAEAFTSVLMIWRFQENLSYISITAPAPKSRKMYIIRTYPVQHFLAGNQTYPRQDVENV
jgi:hypothetical protein